MQSEAASSSRERSEVLRILSITHNLADQRAVAGLLEQSGHRVEAVGNGHSALAALEDRRFDIVLLDTEIREAEIAETVAAIRDRETVTGAHLPIIAVTSHAPEPAREEHLGAGMDAWVSKPIQVTELLQTIESLTKPAMEDSGQPARHRPQIIPTVETYALTQSMRLLGEIQAAIVARDLRTIRDTSDVLKGSITSVLAKEAFEIASILEKTLHEDDLVRAQEACRRLRVAITNLNPSTSERQKTTEAKSLGIRR
jgi:CheY-like chemotaxis protein